MRRVLERRRERRTVVTLRVSAGSPARPRDRRAARATRDILTDELSRVRAAALAWRNGLGALLAGLVGFSLIKGRTDVTQLQPVPAATVGGLLVFALGCGFAAAVLLLRAAHGLPRKTPVREVIDRSAEEPALASRLAEATAAGRALRHGVALFAICTVLLCAAVGLTWYGPPKDKPRVQVLFPDGGAQCGEVISLDAARLTLKTPAGPVALDLGRAAGLGAVESCPVGRP